MYGGLEGPWCLLQATSRPPSCHVHIPCSKLHEPSEEIGVTNKRVFLLHGFSQCYTVEPLQIPLLFGLAKRRYCESFIT